MVKWLKMYLLSARSENKKGRGKKRWLTTTSKWTYPKKRLPLKKKPPLKKRRKKCGRVAACATNLKKSARRNAALKEPNTIRVCRELKDRRVRCAPANILSITNASILVYVLFHTPMHFLPHGVPIIHRSRGLFSRRSSNPNSVFRVKLIILVLFFIFPQINHKN